MHLRTATVLVTLALSYTGLAGQDVGNNGGVPYSAGKAMSVVNRETTVIEEPKGVIFDSNVDSPADPGGEKANGAKYYCFVLQPKEKLSLRLKTDSPNRLGMMPLRPAKMDKMESQFRRVSIMPKTLVSSRFEMKNITDGPYELVVMVYGTVNHAYTLLVERKS